MYILVHSEILVNIMITQELYAWYALYSQTFIYKGTEQSPL